MAERVFLAVDLGASGGRVVAGRLAGERLSLEEVHRFENGPVQVGPTRYWDLLRLWTNVCEGLRAAHARYGAAIASLGVDTWGVDFGLLGRGGELLANPRHYRDALTEGILERAFEIVPRPEIFRHTGLQFMPFNTLYQLLALRLHGSPLLDVAESLLMIPDLFHWMLTGVQGIERTNATTTQCYNPATRRWASELLEKFGLPSRVFGDLIEPGSDLGTLRPHVAEATGLAGVRVIAPGTHDTASAVLAVPAASAPAARPDWCYISSGTWALMGAEVPQPVVNDACLRLNFTNEGGVGETIRLLKNITGLWLLQECRRVFRQQGREYSWDQMTRLAEAAPRHAAFINPDDPRFAAPGDMPAAIRAFCQATGQAPPADDGGVVRVATESLALRCRQVLSWLEELVGGRMETIHIVGGGTLNRQLCQAIADACGRRVAAGPVEATALGNLMMQCVAAGAVGSIAEARQLVRRSFSVEEYLPRDAAAWDDAYGRFVNIVNRGA